MSHLKLLPPVQKLMRVALSNGATLQMPTPALKTRAFYATQVGMVLRRRQACVKLRGAQQPAVS
jgi:hypothetical protein